MSGAGMLMPHLPYDAEETLESFVRRLASFHTGRDAQTLLADLRIERNSFLAGSTEAIVTLAAASGVAPDILMGAAVRRFARHREFRGERWSGDFVRAEGELICPKCLAEDAVDGRGWMLKGRISWRLRSVLTCVDHDCRLVPPPVPGEIASAFQQLAAGEGVRIMAQSPSDLELAISKRLARLPTGAGDWMDGQTVEQGARACEMIGATLLHGLTFEHKSFSPEDWQRAGAMGFEFARLGEEIVLEALSCVAALATTTAGQAGPKAIYGRIYEWLAYSSPAVDPGPIRVLLREHILNSMVIEPGQLLLGERVEGRRLHSVHSLSKWSGLHRKRLRKILVQAGMASDDSWDIAANRLVFPAEEAEQLCRGVLHGVSLHDVPNVIGCSRSQAESLFQDGVLRSAIPLDPRYGIGKLTFAKRDLKTLLQRLEPLPLVSEDCQQIVNLVNAAKRTGLRTGLVMKGVLSGEVPASRIGGDLALRNIRFRLADLDPIRTRRPPSAVHPG
ncbi:TniQ family protein [Pararhodobacter sp.]|uniref:TniQ family protein n=1 Tax=Pararhodobacter sp. TaxID=2127056 RepID=UPI002FDEFEAE